MIGSNFRLHSGLFGRSDADVRVPASADLEKSRLFTLWVKARPLGGHPPAPSDALADCKDPKLSAWPSPTAIRGPRGYRRDRPLYRGARRPTR